MWNTILQSETNTPCVPNLTIKEVPSSELSVHNIKGGAAIPRLDKGNLHTDILINRDLPMNLKITILYHELGHAIDFNKYNDETIKYISGNLNDKDTQSRKVRTELAAFTHSLKSLLTLAKSGNVVPLQETIRRITQRSHNDPDIDYKEAINKLMKLDIWNDCLEELNKNK